MMTYRGASEGEHFKRTINLIDFLCARYGFIHNPKKREETETHLIRGEEKIAVRRNNEGKWLFSVNVGDKSHQGSIIDALIRWEGCHDFRDALRWLKYNYSNKLVEPIPRAPEKPKKDYSAILNFIQNETVIDNCHPYLLKRRLSHETLQSTRFKEKVRRDSRNNAVFTHHTKKGVLCGYELKNLQYTSFSKLGIKGVWFSNITPEDQNLYFCESAVECLSLYEINMYYTKRDNSRYISIGGRPSPLQLELALSAINKMTGKVHLAFNNDDGGRALASKFQEIAPETKFELTWPSAANNDWNDELKALKRTGVI